MKRKRLKVSSLGLTLVEMIISVAVFAIVLMGILLTAAKTKEKAASNLLRATALFSAQSRLNQIFVLPFTDPSASLGYTNSSVVNNFYTFHQKNSPPFSAALSGLYPAGSTSASILSGSSARIRSFDEDTVGCRQRYSNPRQPGAIPFVFNDTDTPLSDIRYYLGKENDDFRNFPDTSGNLFYYCTSDDLKNSTFPTEESVGLLFADDVDDFDGCIYTISDVFKDVDITIQVAVRAHFQNFSTSADYLIRGTSGALSYVYTPTLDTNNLSSSLAAFDDMGKIDPLRFFNNGGVSPMLTDRNNSDQWNAALRLAFELYRRTVFKEVVVSASWEYPQGKPVSLFVSGVKAAGDATDVRRFLAGNS